jgi:hypothetical protein
MGERRAGRLSTENYNGFRGHEYRSPIPNIATSVPPLLGAEGASESLAVLLPSLLCLLCALRELCVRIPSPKVGTNPEWTRFKEVWQ